MVSRRLRVFLDTSVLVAGVLSPEGGAGAILEACRLGLIELYLSPGVIREASNKFLEKFPEVSHLFLQVIKELKPILVDDPTARSIHYAAKIISDPDDAPILAAAQLAPIDCLITLDAKHFLTEMTKTAVSFSIVTPGEFLKIFQG